MRESALPRGCSDYSLHSWPWKWAAVGGLGRVAAVAAALASLFVPCAGAERSLGYGGDDAPLSSS